jgi:peptidyl-prolyl cis-trans isomerase B (cyclophilin B)
VAAAVTGLSELDPTDETVRMKHRLDTPKAFAAMLANHPDVATQPDMRLAVAEGVGSFKTKDAKEVARGLLHDPDVRVRRAAAESLEKMGEEKPEVAPAGPLAGPAAPLDDAFIKSRPGRFTAVVTTNRGRFEIELLHREAPRTVANFVSLAEKKFYDGLSFHRVVPNFVVQGGCPIGNGWGHPGYSIRCEYNPLRYERGMVGMAHAGKDTGGSQWFVTHSPQRHLDGRYTLFGMVVEGMDVVDALRVEDTIESIEIRRKLF